MSCVGTKFSFNAFWALAFSFCALLLAPFLQWWLSFPNNRYFSFSSHCFFISISLFLFNFSGILKTTLSDFRPESFLIYAKFARLLILFGFFAPISAFFISSFYGQNPGYGIYSGVDKLSGLNKALLLLPVFFLCGLTDFVRHFIEREGFEEEKDEEES